MRRSNCFVWAAWFFFFRAWPYWLKNKRKCRDYPRWTTRPSRHIWGLHWLVMHPRYGRWIHYEPRVPEVLFIRAAIHKLWYEGQIVRDDPYKEHQC